MLKSFSTISIFFVPGNGKETNLWLNSITSGDAMMFLYAFVVFLKPPVKYFIAVFSPTPGIPGMLSDLQPAIFFTLIQSIGLMP